jgi:hypothetical protein
VTSPVVKHWLWRLQSHRNRRRDRHEPSSRGPDAPFCLTPRWDVFEDTQVIEEYNEAVISSQCVSQKTVTSRTTRGAGAEAGASRNPTPLDSNRLGFLPLAEWDAYKSYDKDIPSRLITACYLCGVKQVFVRVPRDLSLVHVVVH